MGLWHMGFSQRTACSQAGRPWDTQAGTGHTGMKGLALPASRLILGTSQRQGGRQALGAQGARSWPVVGSS